MIRRIATQKSGMESPRNATKVTVWSRAEWRRSAEISPAGTAITVAIRNEKRGERDGARESLGDDPRHLEPAAEQGRAEIALQHEAEPLDVLHPDRLIEPEFLADLLGGGRDRRRRTASPRSDRPAPPAA